MLKLAIDFDGTLVESRTDPLTWRPGARDGLLGLHAAGHRLILHSCRSSIFCSDRVGRDLEDAEFWRTGAPPPSAVEDWDTLDGMLDFLRREGVLHLFHEVWRGVGKPKADAYIDDRYEAPDWGRIRLELAGGGR